MSNTAASNTARVVQMTLSERIDNMTETEHAALTALHRLMDEVVNNPRLDKYEANQFIEDIEYTMQGLWGFTRDRDFHIHWLRRAGCTCPKMDNHDLMGAPYRYIKENCPHHKLETPF
jgi:hypothetical protein